MLSHIVSDLHEAYVEEILKPQLGSSNAPKPTSSGEGAPKSASDPDEAAAKRIRQAVYDIRYRARREDIPLDQAFNQYMSHTSMNAVEKKSVREKLGMGVGGGGAAPVKEETQDIEEYAKPGEYYLRVDPRKRGTGEKPYVRKYDPSNPKDVAKRHKLETRGIKTTATKHGTPYEGGSSGAGEKFEKKFGPKTGNNTVGDLDKDGTKEPDSHEFAGRKDTAIKKAIAKRTNSPAPKKPNAPKKKAFKEGFSNWRQDLCEISNPDDEIESSNEKQIKEKKVDNYSGGKNKRVVNINPQFNESIENLGGQLIESTELSEDFLIETSNYAADYFFKMGLNDDGLEIVIEDLGLDNFAEFVFELSEEYFLSEELKKSQSKVKTSKAPKGTKQYATTTARVKKQGGTKMSTKDRVGSTIRKDRVNKAVEKAKETQSSKKPVRDAIARGIFGAVKAYQAGMERHRKAMGVAKETGKTVAKAAKVTHEAGRRAGESKIGQAVKKVGGAVVKAGVEKVKKDIETTKQALKKEEVEQIDEVLTKKTSVKDIIKDFVQSKDPQFSGDTKQQRIDRALGAYYGMHPEKSKKKVDEEVGSIPGKPSNQQPETATTQRDTQRKQQQINAQKKTLMTKAAELAAQRAQLSKGIPLQTQSYDMEGELVDERTRYAKETGKHVRTGRPSVEGGDPRVKERNKRPIKYGGSRQKPKVPGEKPPIAGEPGSGVQSPSHKAALRRNARQRAADFRMPTTGT
jgi:hypothetical protein